jgi:acyl-CoA synthetase (AMP-forming)/AMP-acid ligase II
LSAPTLWQLIEARARATPAALCAVDMRGRRMSFADFRDRARAAAAGLAELGIGAGTPVSWILPTRIEAMVLAAALARLSAVQNPILPMYRAREVGFVTRQTGARWLLVPRRFRGFDYEAMARELAAARDLAILAVDDALPVGDPSRLAPAPAAADPVRWLYYTSGTTADPKGARHSDATLGAAAAGMTRAFALGPADRAALVFPFTHVGGCLWLMASLLSGAASLVAETFDDAAIEFFAEHGVTCAGAGTVFHQAYLAAQRRRGGRRLFPAVRACPGGGAPKPPGLHADVKRELGGVGIVSGYGLTECPAVAMNTIACGDDKLARTEGRAHPAGAEIQIVGPDGQPRGPGEEGEILVRGPQLCKGYVDGALDCDAFSAHGFFRTGDLGTLDADGYLTVTGRLKDIIIRKGENISAKEVEDLLYEHPKVADVAVIGLPDPVLGERCCAVVAARAADAPLGFDEMVAYLAGRGLMKQKIPEQLELVSEVPRNPSGKIEKRALRARFSPPPGEATC